MSTPSSLLSQAGSDTTPAVGGWSLDPQRSGVFARLEGDAIQRGVLRVGPDGLDIRTDDPALLPGDDVLPLQLVTPRRLLAPLPVIVDTGRPALPDDPGRVLLRYAERPRTVFQDLLGLLEELRTRGVVAPAQPATGVTEIVSDPARVKEVLRSLLAHRAAGTLLAGPGATLPLQSLAPVPGDPRPLRFAVAGRPGATPRTVRLEGFNSVFEVPVSDPAWADGVLACALPAVVRRVRRRDERRCLAPAGMEVSFRHPMWPQFEVRRPAHDISPHGLSFCTTASDDLLMPGLDLQEVRVMRGSREVARVDGQVRRLAPTPGDGSLVAGLSVHPAGEREARRWREVSQDAMTPTARTRGTPVDASWSLFVESGYFGLSDTTPAQFQKLQDDFDRCSRLVDEAPDLGCQAVFPSDRGIECSFTIHRLYQGTYFPGQLAKRKGGRGAFDSRQILRDVHLRMYEHIQHDPDLRWLIVYLHEATRWTQMAYRDFPAKYYGTGEAWMQPFDAWVADCAADDGGPRDAALSFGPADADERARLVEVAAASRSPQYADALDLVPERLDLASLSARWQRAGLSREREILVARRDGVAQAAALLETGDVGTHLFHMYDSVRLYTLAEGGDQAYADLLRVARQWYADRGRTTAVYCREDGDANHAGDAGWRRLGGASLLVMSTGILPDFLECIHEVTAPGDVTLEEGRNGEAGQAA